MKNSLRDLFWLVLVCVSVVPLLAQAEEAKDAIRSVLGERNLVVGSPNGGLQLTITENGDSALAKLALLDGKHLVEVTEIVVMSNLASAKKWEHLSRLTELNFVCLSSPAKWSRELGSELSKLKKLESLHLDGTCVNNEGIRQISKCVVLQSLNLQDCDLSKCDLSPLGELKELRQLMLSDTGISSEQVQFVDKLPKIGWLALNGTKVDAKIVETLSRCSSLEIVGLIGTKVDAQAVAKLKRALPGCFIASGPQ